MSMNVSKGNMYNFVTHTWNPIKGKCPHDCKYCYMKRFPVGELRLVEEELKTDLGKGNTIFIGSSTDMFAKEVPVEWINRVLLHCNSFPKNTYLFQSKNPGRFLDGFNFPPKTILGTTIESNRDYEFSNAPAVVYRYSCMTKPISPKIKKMISIEPILDFDLNIFTAWIYKIKPEFVSIGADSKGHNLTEPSAEKLLALIKNLKGFTEIRSKKNLNRILEAGENEKKTP